MRVDRRKLLEIAMSVTALSVASPLQAAEANFTAVPTQWRLQNYVGNGINVWFTGVPNCPNGGLSLGSTATADDRNRFWALVMTAKSANRSVLIYYDTTTCVISSFGWPENG